MGFKAIAYGCASIPFSLLGFIFFFALFTRTLTLTSYSPVTVLMTGACGKDEFYVDSDYKEFCQKEGFTYKGFGGFSFQTFPKENVLLRNNKSGQIIALNDINIITNIMLLLGASILVAAGTDLAAAAVGFPNSDVFANFVAIYQEPKWWWVRTILTIAGISAVLIILASLIFSMWFKITAPEKSAFKIDKSITSPGKIFEGTLVREYVESETSSAHNNKRFYYRQRCVKLTNIYPFPLYATCNLGSEENAGTPLDPGTPVRVQVGDKYEAICLDNRQ